MIPAALLLAAGLVFADDSATPPALSPIVDVERQNLLVEMRERMIIPVSSEYWRPEDRVMLEHLRRVEKRDAFELLRGEVGSLRGLVVEHRSPDGRKLWLTKLGYERYQFLRSQKARQYFEDQGVEASIVFKLKDPLGKRIFTPKGILTPEGDDLYDRASDGLTIRWTDPFSGKIVSSGEARPGVDE